MQSVNSRPPAPLAPKEFVWEFAELTGVTLCVRWVQKCCKRGRIKAGGSGRYLIQPGEVRRLAADLKLIPAETEASR